MSLAGSFLVARSVLQDENFAQTVVLLLAHSTDGAFGLVVNRPAPEPVEGLSVPVFFGGPCPAPGLLLLHGHADWQTDPNTEEADQQEVAPGIFVGNAACLERASEPSAGEPLRLRVFSGYAGWAGGQLEGEIAAGAWAVVPAAGQLLFDTPVEELWDRLAPPSLPQPSLN
jgi:putative transcriptional regulator